MQNAESPRGTPLPNASCSAPMAHSKGGGTESQYQKPAARHSLLATHCSPPTVALLGNPNTGKTTLFNALAGMRQRVGNYPGVTVEIKKGRIIHEDRVFHLIDLPGTYSLAPRSPDEMIAVDLVLGQQAHEQRPDVIVAIVDASNLERNLYLTTQAMELGVPVIVALNMIDVAERQSITIDVARLSQQLGVPVVPIQANKKKGLDQLKKVISRVADASWQVGHDTSAERIAWPSAFKEESAQLARALGNGVPSFLIHRLLLDAGGYTERCLVARHGAKVVELAGAARRRMKEAGLDVTAVEARSRYAWIRQAIAGCIHRPQERPITHTDRLDSILTHRVWGTLIFLTVMFTVFQALFSWARPVMKAIGAGKDLLADWLEGVLTPGPFTDLLVGGVLEGVGSVVVFLPQIVILFGFIAILEDCGYMARAAYLMDKLMSRCGLSGKSFIPLLSSMACAIPGIMATRVIENRTDRLTTILVAPLMSCSARLPVYILMAAAFLGHIWWLPGLVIFCMYALGLAVAPIVALMLKRTLLRGETPPFVMEMPLYKMPSFQTILRRMTDSAWAFVRRAGTIILASMVLVWALLYFPRHDGQGGLYDARVAAAREHLEELKSKAVSQDDAQTTKLDGNLIEQEEEKLHQLYGEWKGQSYLGRAGQAVEPLTRPLGWDWKISMAALASFPAREIVVGTMGIIYNQGKVDVDEIREAENPADTRLARALMHEPIFTVPTALSLMVFFALCCQCASTLAVIKRETRSWRWPVFTFFYMTTLAYLGALLTYQVGTWISSG